MSIAFVHLQSDSAPDRGRLELLLFLLTWTQSSCWPSHRASCLLWDVKRRGKGGTKFFKNTEVMDCCGRQFAAPSARATGSTKFSSAQEGASQLSVKACDWQSFSFKRGMPRKDKESSWDREMEAVAQNWRALQAEQVSVGSSLLSYMTGNRITDVRKSSSRKYLWRENARMKLFCHRMYTQWIEKSG